MNRVGRVKATDMTHRIKLSLVLVGVLAVLKATTILERAREVSPSEGESK